MPPASELPASVPAGLSFIDATPEVALNTLNSGLAAINRRDTLPLQQGNKSNDADDDQIDGHEVIQESGRKQNEYAGHEGERRCYEGAA
jgi:hypothetical protein